MAITGTLVSNVWIVPRETSWACGENQTRVGSYDPVAMYGADRIIKFQSQALNNQYAGGVASNGFGLNSNNLSTGGMFSSWGWGNYLGATFMQGGGSAGATVDGNDVGVEVQQDCDGPEHSAYFVDGCIARHLGSTCTCSPIGDNKGGINNKDRVYTTDYSDVCAALLNPTLTGYAKYVLWTNPGYSGAGVTNSGNQSMANEIPGAIIIAGCGTDGTCEPAAGEPNTGGDGLDRNCRGYITWSTIYNFISLMI